MALENNLTQRIVVLASADTALRGRLRESLTGMRWRVCEARGGAEAMAQLEELRPEALLLDSWLPDLEVSEFAGHIREMFPGLDLLRVDGDMVEGTARSPRRHELLHALREAQEPLSMPTDGPAWSSAPVSVPVDGARRGQPMRGAASGQREDTYGCEEDVVLRGQVLQQATSLVVAKPPEIVPLTQVAIPGLIGSSHAMQELARMVRLVAPRSATVLIEGETGSGKEVVAKALHQLSARAQKSFTVLNCAAIPEALLEAELFGHTRGAFTGAVSSRTGRIEAAHGGTLFLDEIGEMPLSLQAKMLRFLECGELQRVGDNEVMRVDVRVIAATHQPLEQRAGEGKFRLDLYHRLAVFPLLVPALRERKSDIAALAEHFLAEFGKEYPRKRLSAEAMRALESHDWPGNVRELAHVLERATILADDSPTIGAADVRLRVKAA